VKIIFADNPLRQTVTADGPISLEDMFEIGYSLIAASDSAAGPAVDPATHFFKSAQARTAMPVKVQVGSAPGSKSADKWSVRRAGRPIFEGGSVKRPRLSEHNLEWPKEVPCIASLEHQPRSSKSPSNSRTLPPKAIVMPQVLANYSASRK
jgi:hypothetical protein